MMQTMVQIRVDRDLKERVAGIYDAIGIDIPTAIRMLFKRSVMVGGLPFESRVEQVARQFRRIDGVWTDKSLDELVKEKRSKCEDFIVNGNLAMESLAALRAKSSENNREWTLDEINAEISAVRRERRSRNMESASK